MKRKLPRLLARLLCVALPAVAGAMAARANVTIEDCVGKARENYPLIKKIGLMDRLQDVDLAEINDSWLPKIGVYGQVTVQNAVPAYPQALSGVLEQMGQDVKGLSRMQYKAGVDVSQTIWDGGASSAKRRLATERSATDHAALEVELYALRERVENTYFAILLTDKQIELNRTTTTLIEANLDKLRAMERNGTAMQSDCDMMEARLLSMRQNIAEGAATLDGLLRVLELYTGEYVPVKQLEIPAAPTIEATACNRPELTLFEKREQTNRLAERLSDTSLMPKVGLFAQAYYGYPGFDYFRSMMNRDLTLNAMAGVKIAWNIDSFYSRKDTRRRTALTTALIQTEKETFLFNNSIAGLQQRAAIEALQKSMAEDPRIVELLANVRKAAESQLDNGVIDTTALLTKITDENTARLKAQLHEIQYLRETYKLKYLINQ